MRHICTEQSFLHPKFHYVRSMYTSYKRQMREAKPVDALTKSRVFRPLALMAILSSSPPLPLAGGVVSGKGETKKLGVNNLYPFYCATRCQFLSTTDLELDVGAR